MGLDFWWIGLILFFIGAHVGSFLNVVIDRLPLSQDFIHGRSECDHCHKTLEWWELVPIVAFVFLRGRCSKCQQKLSYQYPLLETLTGLVFVLVFFRHSPTLSIISWIEFLFWLILFSSLLVIGVIDFKSKIIPDKLILFLIFVFAVESIVELAISVLFLNLPLGNSFLSWSGSIIEALTTAGLAGLFFYALVWITNGKGMGGGDVKLAFVIGLFLTRMQTVMTIYAAFVIGGVIASILLLMKRKKFGQTIPFGPFLVLGAFIAFVWAELFNFSLW